PVEAYLRPSVSAYLVRLERDMRDRGVGTVRVMTSSGGTLSPPAAAARSASLALSGPAGGVVGARLIGTAVGLRDLLTLDMGGTSADASLVRGGLPHGESAGSVAGIPLALPAILIETVSAGGGSVARVDEGGALKVGPESAGAVPGPACYGRGGERPTVTDACLALRWLDAQHPLADEVRLDPDAGTLSAMGLASAAERVDRIASFHRLLDDLAAADVAGAFAPLLDAGARALAGGALLRYADCRFAGQGYEMTVPITDDDPRRIRQGVLAEHRARY